MKNLIRIPLNGINSINILGKWCVLATFDAKMGEWNFYEFNKLNSEVKKHLKTTYDLTDNTIKEIADGMKKSSKKPVKYGKILNSRDWSVKILLALNDIEPKKLIEPEWWESTLLKEYVAKYSNDKSVLKTLFETNLENVHKVLKKRDDYKELLSEFNMKTKRSKTVKTDKSTTKKTKGDTAKSMPVKRIKKQSVNTITTKRKTTRTKKTQIIDELFS